VELWQQNAASLRQLITSRQASAYEVTQAHLLRIDQVNTRLNAIVHSNDEQALIKAKTIDQGQIGGALAGVPITTKINTDHIGFPTDNGVKAFKALMPSQTLPCVQGLLDEGAIVTGRTNAPALSLPLHTGNDLHGETINALDPAITPGGSSGGAAVAVASGMCAIAQGNDVGGSIRFPAFCNGVLGFKPSQGRLPMRSTNLVMPRPFISQIMSTNGVIARSIDDVRLGLLAMSKDDPSDPNWSPVSWNMSADPAPCRVALILEDGLNICALTRASIERVGAYLSDAGYQVEMVNPPALDQIFSLWQRIGGIELQLTLLPQLAAIDDPGLTNFMTDWAQFLPKPDLAVLHQAIIQRDSILRSWAAFFDRYPLIIAPAFTRMSMAPNEDLRGPETLIGLMDGCRYLFGLSALGLPSLAMPIVHDHNRLHGVQIIARRWQDHLCLDAGAVIERAQGVRPVVTP
jgi:amidase